MCTVNLIDLSLPDEIDLSNGKSDLTITAKFDQPANLQDEIFFFITLSRNLNSYTLTGTNILYMGYSTDEDAYSGYVHEISIPIQPYNESGAYYIENVTIIDLRDGDTSTYSAGSLQEQGITTSFSVAGGDPDSTPSSIMEMTFPNEIDLSNGSQSLQIDAKLYDDFSGVFCVSINLDREINTGIGGETDYIPVYYGTDPWYSSEELLLEGVSSLHKISKYNNSGQYKVTKIEITDFAGNSNKYLPEELLDLNISSSFEVTNGINDETAPEIISLEIPSHITLSESEQEFTYSVTFEDDVSGVWGVWIELDTPSNIPDFLHFDISDPFGSQGPLSGEHQGESAFSQFIDDGIYNVTSATIYDYAGNSREYSPEELEGMGANISIEVRSYHNKFIVPDGYIRLIDYVDGDELVSDFSFEQSGTGITAQLGSGNTNGSSLSRQNLLETYYGTSATIPLLRIPLSDSPSMDLPVEGFFSLRVTSKQSGFLSAGYGLEISFNTLLQEDSYGKKIAIVEDLYNLVVLSAGAGFSSYPIYTSNTDVIGNIISGNGFYLELEIFSFLKYLKQLLPIDGLLESLIAEGDYEFHMETDLPLFHENGQEITTMTLDFPITDSGNHAPQFAVADQDMTEDTDLIVDLNISDLEDDNISYEILNNGCSDTVQGEIIGDQLHLSPGSDFYTITPIELSVMATDSKGGSSIETINVTVEDVPHYQGEAGYYGSSRKLIQGIDENAGQLSKAVTATDKSAIELTDVLLILKHYLGKESLEGYALSAADYDDDGEVTLSDVLGTLKCYLGKAETTWSFQDAVSGSDVDIVGVLKGDVTGTWEPTL